MAKKRISTSDIHGIIVPMVTPFKGKDAEKLDLSALAKLTEFLIKNGVHGLMPLGTSGEFGLLNREERRTVIETVVRTASGRVPVIAGVSSSGTDNAIELAKDAANVGADAMISTGPYYYRTTEAGLFLHFQSLIDKVDLPLMVYNIPGWAGYDIPAKVVLDLWRANKSRVLGVKFTTNDLGDFLSYLRMLKEKISIMIGADSLAFSALGLGAAGGVLGSANLLPRETVQIYENFTKGNFEDSRKMQARIDRFTEAMTIGTYPAALKYALQIAGVDCGPVRRPLIALSMREKKALRESIAWKMN